MGKFSAFNLRDLMRGLILPFRGVRYLVIHRGLKRYAALPLALNIILYAVAGMVFFHFLWNWDVGQAAWEFWGPVGGWLASAANWIGWLVKFVVVMLALGAAFFTFTAIGMVIASPLNDLLSEKVEVVYTGGAEKLGLPFRFTAKAAFLSVLDALRNLVMQFACTLAALPFLLVPVVGFLPLFLVGGYFAGFGFLDSAMARNFLRPPQKRLLARKRFWEIIGFGIAMQILFAIPLMGLLLMPIGVTSGTLVYCDEDWEKLFAEAGVKNPKGFIPPKRMDSPGATSASGEGNEGGAAILATNERLSN